MVVRPLAAYRVRPIHKSVVRKTPDADLITVLTEGEPLSIKSMKKPLKVLKPRPGKEDDGGASD